MNITPTEHQEQCTLVEWMEYQGLKFTAIPNSTYTKSWKQKVKNTQSGLRPGLPDLLIIIPIDKSRTCKAEMVFIELKRQKGGKTSESQKEWIEAINGAGVAAHICKGCDEAIEVLSSYMN